MAEIAPVNVPLSQSGQPVQIVPSQSALASTTNSSLSTSSTLTLNAGTTFVEINAINQAIYMKWGATVSTANNGWDEYILPGQTRHYAVPTGVTQMSLIESAVSATAVIIEKSKGY
jgi:hypothetical protein